MNRMKMNQNNRETGIALIVAAVLLALLLLSLSSCSDDAPADDAWRRAHAVPISFGTAADVADPGPAIATRTAWGTLSLDGTSPGWSLRERGFGVFASHTGTYRYASSTARPNLMWNQPVTYTNAEDVWAYSPLVYWPTTDAGADEYVSFFAYGPYSDGTTGDAAAAIVDFSLPGQTGDPWLLYQLAGTEDDWRSSQVDLVWAQVLDRTRPVSVFEPVVLDFHHALACYGDGLTFAPSEACRTRMCDLCTRYATPVSLTLTSLTLDYELTSKGRLVLNSTGDAPNWQPVLSGPLRVHRRITLSPNQVIAHATSATACTLTPYEASDQGIFFLPIDISGEPQQLTVTAAYTLSIGQAGTSTLVVSLAGARAGERHNLRLNFTLPDTY